MFSMTTRAELKRRAHRLNRLKAVSRAVIFLSRTVGKASGETANTLGIVMTRAVHTILLPLEADSAVRAYFYTAMLTMAKENVAQKYSSAQHNATEKALMVGGTAITFRNT